MSIKIAVSLGTEYSTGFGAVTATQFLFEQESYRCLIH